MQPIFAITCPIPCLIEINGRFAGEADSEHPLFVPVAAYGPVYLGYHPLQGGYLSAVRKLVFSGSAPMAESLEQTDDLLAICWPGGITEVEWSPTPVPEQSLTPLKIGSRKGRLILGACARLELGTLTCPLPASAGVPQVIEAESGILLIGPTRSGQYALTLSPNGELCTGMLQASAFQLEADGSLSALTDYDDVAGHGVLERWQPSLSGLTRQFSRPVWIDGAPRQPDSPEKVARAALEAAQLGEQEELKSYLSPGFSDHDLLRELAECQGLCVPMKFSSQSADNRIGMMQLISAQLARVRPVLFQTDARGQLLSLHWAEAAANGAG